MNYENHEKIKFFFKKFKTVKKAAHFIHDIRVNNINSECVINMYNKINIRN